MQLFIYVLFFFVGGLLVYYYQKNRITRFRQVFQQRINDLVNSKNDSLSEKSGSNALSKDFQELIKLTESSLLAVKNKDATITLQKNTTENQDQLKKSIENLYLVNELGRKVTSSLNLHQTFQHLYTTINSMMDAAILELYSYDAESNQWKLFSNITYADTKGVISDSYRNHMAEWSISNNREVYLTDAENDFGRYVFQPLQLPDGRIVKSIMIFPISENYKVTATLSVMSFQKNMYGEYHQEIIRLLLGYIAVAMNNSFTHDELNRTKIRAEQSEKFKEQFLANMSHEIRTPINAVTGMTRLMLEKDPRPDQLKYLESIRNASDSLLVIINDILDLSKIEAGQIEFEKIDFSLIDVLNNVKGLMQFKAEEKGLILIEEIDQTIPPVLVGDPTRLSQILINLIGNALKFTEKGSIILRVVNKKLLSGNSATAASILFEVVDTGIGMNEDQLNKLFKNYSQASTETSRRYGGTGLGLSISKQLVEIQGGTIGVTSKSGIGSNFYFTLTFPISKNQSVSTKEQTIAKEMLAALKGKRILIADDNEYNRIVARESLELKVPEIIVEEAFDGIMSLDMFKQNEYDLILMDITMPRMDGFEATRKIRNEFPAPKNAVQILALTAAVVKSEIDKCYEAGMNGFIPKPFKAHELIIAIYSALSGEEIEVSNVATKIPNNTYASAVVDLEYLLDFVEGDKVRMKRYIDLFLKKIPLGISNIKSALQINDIENIRIYSHSMKPQLQSAGVFKGFQIAETIETICINNKDTGQLPQLIEDLADVCHLAVLELSELPIN